MDSVKKNVKGTSVIACVEYFRKYCVNIRIHAAAMGVQKSWQSSRAMQKTRAIVSSPERATGNFAAKSETPQTFMESASSQMNIGGYSKFRTPLSRTFHQSPVMSICLPSCA